jgi:hypothetical protein
MVVDIEQILKTSGEIKEDENTISIQSLLLFRRNNWI